MCKAPGGASLSPVSSRLRALLPGRLHVVSAEEAKLTACCRSCGRNTTKQYTNATGRSVVLQQDQSPSSTLRQLVKDSLLLSLGFKKGGKDVKNTEGLSVHSRRLSDVLPLSSATHPLHLLPARIF